jgi:UDP-MurNAc hydroxylase
MAASKDRISAGIGNGAARRCGAMNPFGNRSGDNSRARSLGVAAMDRIVWVNHASFLLETGSIRLLTDPWLDGTAFNDGWALHSPTTIDDAELARVTHIWISHEHSDHFAPASLRHIPAEIRSAITLLYQETRDRRVLRHCRELGFNCIELAPGRDYALTDDVRVRCEPFGNGDSWLLIVTPQGRYLNLNDCPARRDDQILAIRDIVQSIDVLFSQFSYAGWVGNPDDRAYRQAEAEVNLRQIVRQAQLLKPNWVVPFASFIYFCHAENFSANDGANEIDAIVDAIHQEAEIESVVLYPGDRWIVGSAWNNHTGIARYREDWARSMREPPRTSPSVPFDQLKEEADAYRAGLRRSNQLIWLRPLVWSGYLRPAEIYLSDLNIAIRFGIFAGLSRTGKSQDACDIALSSSSLSYCFRHLWGHSTLSINGRFQVPPNGARQFFMRQFAIGLDNSKGHFFPRDTILTYVRKHFSSHFRREQHE